MVTVWIPDSRKVQPFGMAELVAYKTHIFIEYLCVIVFFLDARIEWVFREYDCAYTYTRARARM